MIRQLRATRFRNLEPLDWSIGAGLQLLLGGTGAGKTSVLEAIYLLATTRSFRTAQLADCVRTLDEADAGAGGGGFYLAAEVEEVRRSRLEVSWNRSSGLERRVNGSRPSLSEHLATLPVLAWTSADVEMLLGVPALRRRFLDRGLLAGAPAALGRFAQYRRTLREKRALLRSPGTSRAALEPWNELLAEALMEVVALRSGYVATLAQALRETVSESGLPFDDLAIEYRPSPGAALEGRAAALEALERAAGRELEIGRPVVGSHQDRLLFRWRGRELARLASAGERKAVGLLLVAAQERVLVDVEMRPVVLLDDADVELDRPTLEAVFGVLDRGGQLVVSSNRPEIWTTISRGTEHRVEGGRITVN